MQDPPESHETSQEAKEETSMPRTRSKTRSCIQKQRPSLNRFKRGSAKGLAIQLRHVSAPDISRPTLARRAGVAEQGASEGSRQRPSGDDTRKSAYALTARRSLRLQQLQLREVDQMQNVSQGTVEGYTETHRQSKLLQGRVRRTVQKGSSEYQKGHSGGNPQNAGLRINLEKEQKKIDILTKNKATIEAEVRDRRRIVDEQRQRNEILRRENANLRARLDAAKNRRARRVQAPEGRWQGRYASRSSNPTLQRVPTGFPADTINHQWKLMEKIGQGAAGMVFAAVNLNTNESVAVKRERVRNGVIPPLHYESIVYNRINQARETGNPIASHFPAMRFCGNEAGFHILVMDRLGPSLKKRWSILGRIFTLRCVLTIGIKMLDALQALHRLGFVHRDIEPGNVLTATGNRCELYLIDFGMSGQLKFRPIHQSQGLLPLTGTQLLAPVAAHMGEDQVAKDDLESLGYMLIYLLRGFLPWSPDSAAGRNLLHAKKNTPFAVLCHGIKVLEEYMQTVICFSRRGLPDYDFLKTLFHNALVGVPEAFDWTEN